MKIALRVVVFVFLLALARPSLAAVGFDAPLPPMPIPSSPDPGALLAG